MASQIPVVRAALSARLPKQHIALLNVLDTVLNVCARQLSLSYHLADWLICPAEQDYVNHQKEIYSKLVDIVRVRPRSALTGPSLRWRMADCCCCLVACVGHG